MAEIREIASGLEFPEGPIAIADGSVLVVEIKRGTLTRVRPDGAVEIVAETGGGPNGAAIGPDGKVYICNNGGFEWHDLGGMSMPGDQPADYTGGSIQRVDLETGAVESVYTECDGIPLKGPNDIVFDSEGGFWFTDLGKSRARERDRTGIFYALPDGSSIREMVFPLETPNGIALSPDQSRVYVAETLTGRVYYWDLEGPGQIRPNPLSPNQGTLAGGSPRSPASRLDGGRRRRQRLCRDDHQRRHHRHLAGWRVGGPPADAGSGDHQHLLRWTGPAHRLHHAVRDRPPGQHPVEDRRPEAGVLSGVERGRC